MSAAAAVLMIVHTFVPTHSDPTHVAVEVGTDCWAMDALAEVTQEHNPAFKHPQIATLINA